MQNLLTEEQQRLVDEFVAVYDIAPDQISFDGDKLEPILDYEALCVFKEYVLDFASIDLRHVLYDPRNKQAYSDAIVVTKRGAEITVREFADMGETLPDGTPINSIDTARRVARARALRSAIRCAGYSVLKAHLKYVETKAPLAANPIDPRQIAYREIHALKNDLGWSQSEYEQFIAESHDGRSSCSDLDDMELQRLKITMRALRRIEQSKLATPRAA